LSRVDEVGFTDLMAGGGTPASSRLDWIEVWAAARKRNGVNSSSLVYPRKDDKLIYVENFTTFLPTELNELERPVGQGGIASKLQPAPERVVMKRQ